MDNKIETTIPITSTTSGIKPSKILSEHTGLSQSSIKDAMQKGAVWLIRRGTKRRIRRASKPLIIDDQLELNYNEQLLKQEVPRPSLIHDAKDYSIWFKPFGLSCQGSRWGDFLSINRWVETNAADWSVHGERPVYLVHRLDRATTGLMILCHSKKATQLFGSLFQSGEIDKHYHAIVKGDFSQHTKPLRVDSAVDGKTALSEFTCVDVKNGYSLVNVKLHTGRKHQIRQHLQSIAYPIVGDRLYGAANSQEPDLQLQSTSLNFICPFTQQKFHFNVSEEKRISLSSLEHAYKRI